MTDRITNLQEQEDLANRLYRTSDGYTIRVFSSMYMDWGLEILGPDGEEIWYSPSALDRESYGFHWTDDDDNDLEEGIPWTDLEWRDALEREADEFIEAYTETV